MPKENCSRPAMLVSAPSSGQGKTTVTAALARRHRLDGRRVRVFKCGPDFLDPTILEAASGAKVYQLDLWMAGEDGCRDLLWRAAREADIVVVEGVMGLFDGNPSAADLARLFRLPVMAVVDSRAMAQTFGAVALGLASFRPDVRVRGVLANRVAGESHARLLRESLPAGLDWYGSLRRGADLELPSRHLGLVQAAELSDLEDRLDRLAGELAGEGAAMVPPPVEFVPGSGPAPPRLLKNVRLAVAKDAAFSFVYQANLDLLAEMGAGISFFSPLDDDRLPPGSDALYLPGGYPELHLERLSANHGLIADIRAFHEAGRPILAECGGLLYLLRSLASGGQSAGMVGLLPGSAVLSPGLRGLGLMSARLPEGEIRGHSFHHSELDMDLEPLVGAVRQDGRLDRQENVYRIGRLTASYLHFYWPSNPVAAAKLFLPFSQRL
ncbi:MAG: cobyrinate a,c-diamide synthase [Deltaproteobacteria bacterium]|jgi:cobyrinic acid a,c-diamide synthase|nr:cobyrinate a,c-diamide synthase [Deltaproteobacteria bacterium]